MQRRCGYTFGVMQLNKFFRILCFASRPLPGEPSILRLRGKKSVFSYNLLTTDYVRSSVDPLSMEMNEETEEQSK